MKQYKMGGHQERNKRAGTENVAGIVGIGTAVNLIYDEFDSYNNKLKYLRDYYITQIEKNIPNIKLNGDKVKRLPGNANISFDGIDAGQLLLNLDAYGICASAGSACTSGSLEPSHVLIAIGLKENLTQGALRTTFGKDNTKEYEELMKKDKEELIEECNKRELSYNDSMTKEELVEILLAPVIIDLSNNIGFIKELETNLKDRIKEYMSSGNNEKRNVHLKNASFNIDMINEDLFRILEYVQDRLTMTWMDKYELAKAYYDHYGDLEISANFKTKNGYEYDENGVALGKWINTQRQAFKGNSGYKISKEQIELLKEIGMKWFPDNIDIKLQKEEINEKNINKKKIEVYNRVIDYLSKYKSDEIPKKEEINSKFIEELDRPLKK